MGDSTSFSVVALPPELEAGELLGCRDQIAARIDAVVIAPKGKKKNQEPVALPEGVVPIDALPVLIALPWKRFNAAALELEKFRAERAAGQADQAHAANDPTEQDLANVDCDDRWRAFEAWNNGATRLADDGEDPSPAEARWLYAQLFPAPEGLRFITRGPRSQWTAMVPRMKVLLSDRAQKAIAAFGGDRHYKQLVKAHKRYGDAFGFSAVVADVVGGPTDGRPQWTTARDTLRTLVQKIENYADPENEGSEALSSYLLKPFAEMVDDLEKGRRTRKKATAAPAAPPAPAEPSAQPPKG